VQTIFRSRKDHNLCRLRRTAAGAAMISKKPGAIGIATTWPRVPTHVRYEPCSGNLDSIVSLAKRMTPLKRTPRLGSASLGRPLIKDEGTQSHALIQGTRPIRGSRWPSSWHPPGGDSLRPATPRAPMAAYAARRVYRRISSCHATFASNFIECKSVRLSNAGRRPISDCARIVEAAPATEAGRRQHLEGALHRG